MKKYSKNLMLFTVLLLGGSSLFAQTKMISLREALQKAAKSNRHLQIQMLEQQKAVEAVKIAKSFLLPTVNANAGYTIYGQRPVIYLRNESANPKLDDVRYGGRFAFNSTVNASYPLIDPTLKSNIRLSEINGQIKKEEMQNAEEQIALEISQLYLTVLMHQEQRKVVEQSLQRNERALKDARSLFLQGKNLKTDTLSNYISVQNLKATLSALDNDILVLSQQLKQLMALPSSTELVYSDTALLTESGGEIISIEQSFEKAESNRRDLKIQSLQVDLSREQLLQTKSAFRPQLYANAAYQLQSQSDHLRVWNYGLPGTSFAGITLHVPLFSGHRLKYKTAQSQIAIRQNEVALAEMRSSVETELTTLNARLKQAYDQWLIQLQNVQAAQVNYTMMMDRYRMGLGNRLELTDAELALTKAKLDQLQSIFSIRLTELQLKKAMGILQLQ